MWVAMSVRYGSGLPVEIEEAVDEATLVSQYGEEILRRVNIETGRVRSNISVDLGTGITLWRRERRRLGLRVELANLMNRLNVINFAGLFSGTAIGAPRSVTAGVQFEF
jgi:outer membrane receptor for Fe3+-dicitrate